MDSLSQDLMVEAFTLGFDYGQKWFLLYLVVILGVLVEKTIRRL